jgi:drug/metabolite transporter (DMT)-like permease
MRQDRRGVVYGLAAALSFGMSAPLAKRLLDDASPQMLAGVLYAGAAIALAAVWRLRDRSHEAQLSRRDLPRLGVVTLSGGVIAPVLLLMGLERVRGITGSLLLNLEAPLTLLVALFFFREHLGRRSLGAAALIFGGATVLTLQPGRSEATLFGAVLIVGACVGWAVDNNVTQSLTVRDPLALVTVKTAIAGSVNITIALARGDAFPHASLLLGALILGAISYGLSVVLDAYALRLLGAGRESAVFATAPFAGALVAVPVLNEHFSAADVAGAAVMALGVALTLTDHHAHVHEHEVLEHEHMHTHDEHHEHEHPAGVSPEEPHSHVHRHGNLVHSHAHVSDVHHRHPHPHSS